MVNVDVEKKKFDSVLGKILQTIPNPLKKIKASGKRGPETPILAKQCL
jgi:hypothetical protein